jgi:phosphoglycerate kinase
MIAPYLTIDQLQCGGKRVLVRADLNVPLADRSVTDDFRIAAALPLIKLLREAGAVVVVCSHLGRPKGPDPAYRMDPVGIRLAELGGFPVKKLDVVTGSEAEAAVGAARPGDVILLENTRFEAGETVNDPGLSDALARLADLFVEDAFGSVHRAHSSTVGVAEKLRSAAGPLLVAEVESLGRFLADPDRPYVVALGGAKVSDKLGVIRNLLPKVDAMLVGGGMCFTFLAADGFEIGKSLVEQSMVSEVRELMTGENGDRIQLPSDVVVGNRFAADASTRTVRVESIPKGWIGLDIGPETVGHFSAVIGGAGSVFWNGPMGVFEWEPFRAGTEATAAAMSASSGFTAVGGGDSVSAMRLLGLENRVSHLSTGGGAGLELLEGRVLPGVAVLARWVDGG